MRQAARDGPCPPWEPRRRTQGTGRHPLDHSARARARHSRSSPRAPTTAFLACPEAAELAPLLWLFRNTVPFLLSHLRGFFVFLKIIYFVYLFIYLFILFLAALGLRCCTQAFSSRGERGATLHCSMQASHCGGFSLLQSTGSRHAGFSTCSTQAQ